MTNYTVFLIYHRSINGFGFGGRFCAAATATATTTAAVIAVVVGPPTGHKNSGEEQTADN